MLQTGMRLLLIGGGNMGGAVARGALRANILQPQDLAIVEIAASAREALAREAGCRSFATIEGASEVVNADTAVMLAVKPQSFGQVATALHEAGIVGQRIFISIMAGLDSARIHQALGAGARIVRCMPNTPCMIGRGMTAIALGMGARPGDEDFPHAIFDALGKTVEVNESQMAAVTAVSGSGPAYVFLLAEAMENAAAGLDLPIDIARLLVRQTIAGAAEMLDRSKDQAAALGSAVTSRGGTTEAAVQVFQHAGFEAIVVDALRAARDRAVELNDLK